MLFGESRAVYNLVYIMIGVDDRQYTCYKVSLFALFVGPCLLFDRSRLKSFS